MQKCLYSLGSFLLLSTIALSQPGMAAVVPKLIFPEAQDVLDNGCLNLRSGIFWTFVWSEVPNATSYHLHVIGATALNPVINNPDLPSPDYIHRQFGSYIADQNRLGWRWKVRAKVNGRWTPWSEERGFDVERLNTDC